MYQDWARAGNKTISTFMGITLEWGRQSVNKHTVGFRVRSLEKQKKGD